jgi:hypothetical protein
VRGQKSGNELVPEVMYLQKQTFVGDLTNSESNSANFFSKYFLSTLSVNCSVLSIEVKNNLQRSGELIKVFQLRFTTQKLGILKGDKKLSIKIPTSTGKNLPNALVGFPSSTIVGGGGFFGEKNLKIVSMASILHQVCVCRKFVRSVGLAKDLPN